MRTLTYGCNHLHLPRVVMQLSAGLALVVSAVAGVLVGTLSSAAWWAVPVAGAIAFLFSHLALALDWHPPGALLLVFAFGGCSAAPHVPGDVVPAVLVTGGSALFAVVIGGLGALERGHTGARPARLRLHRSWLPVRSGVAVVVAGALAVWLGIGHPYWAMVAAVAPLTVRDVTGQLTRATHRVGGTLLGLVPAAFLLALGLRGLVLVLVVAVLRFVTELLVGRNYGLALILITRSPCSWGRRPIPSRRPA